MRRLLYVWLATILVSCVATPAATRPASSVRVDPSPASFRTSPAATVLSQAGQEAVTGPGGMTLGQEIGAVMMVGLSGPITPATVDHWRQRQFGGLLLLPGDRYTADPAGTRTLIESLREVMAHPLLAVTDRAAADMTGVAAGLKALGFDVDLEPHAELPSGHGASEVTATIGAIHAAGMDAVASVSTPGLTTQELVTLRAAIEARVDMVMVGDLGLTAVRRQLGFQGVVISDDLPSSDSALQFLENGGDMVVIGHDLATADSVHEAIHLAVLNGRYRRSQLDASVQKLLNLGLRFMP